MRPIRLEIGPVPEGALSPEELEQMGTILAPFVKPEACVGCGLCESRCSSAVARQQKALARSAIVVTPDGAGGRIDTSSAVSSHQEKRAP